MVSGMNDYLDARFVLLDRTNRRRQHYFARTRHYYWIECPVCGVWFGGHEARYVYDGGLRSAIRFRPLGPTSWIGDSICPECVVAGYGQQAPLPEG